MGTEAAGAFALWEGQLIKVWSSALDYRRLHDMLGDIVVRGRPDAKYPMPTDVPYQVFKKWGTKPADVHLWRVREVKSANEKRKIKEAERITLEILDGIDWRKPEDEIARQLKLKSLKEADGWAFEPIVAADEHTRYPHWQPTHTTAERMLLVDFGVKYEGYCADVTDMYFAGELEEYDRVKEAFKQLSYKAKPGYPVRLLAKAFPIPEHALGHGIGMDVHEVPLIVPTSHKKLREGMVLALEPAMYTEEFGVRYEREVFV